MPQVLEARARFQAPCPLSLVLPQERVQAAATFSFFQPLLRVALRGRLGHSGKPRIIYDVKVLRVPAGAGASKSSSCKHGTCYNEGFRGGAQGSGKTSWKSGCLSWDLKNEDGLAKLGRHRRLKAPPEQKPGGLNTQRNIQERSSGLLGTRNRSGRRAWTSL